MTADEPDVRVRFHYFDGVFNSRWWQIDDAFVGTRTCAPLRGGLVLGHVHDRNTGEALNGATVTSNDNAQENARSMATPDDPGLADGFYWMFSSLTGSHRFIATTDSYSSHTRKVSVEASRATEQDFQLPAGQLVVEPDEITASPRLGGTAQRTFTVTNIGTAPARVDFRERQEPYEIPRAADTTLTGTGMVGSDRPIVRIEGDFSPLSGPGTLSAAGPLDAPHGPAATPWLDLPDYPTRIMDNTVGELDGRIYSVGGVDGLDITAKGFVYDPAQQTWTEIAEMPEGREAAAGAFIGDLFYVSGGWDPGVRATRSTFVYDPASDTWSSGADAPVSAAAAARAVLDGQLYLVGGCTNACDGTDVRRYDPVTDTWDVLADYPQPAGHLACGGIVYCAGGIRRGGTTWKSTYAYEPATDTWTQRADLPIDLWGMAYTTSYDTLLVSGGITSGAITNEGFVYDPETDAWSRLPASNNVLYRGGSACGLNRIGGSVRSGFVPSDAVELLPTYADCIPADVSWMSLEPAAATVAPGRKVKVTIHMSADVAQPGTHTAGVWIKEDTPYLVHPVDVIMNVSPGAFP